MNSKNALAISTVLLLLACSAQATTTVLDDSFADGDRTTDNLPSSTPWYISSSSGLSVVSNTLVMSDNRTALGYFTPVTLATGDILTVSFTFTLNTPPTNTDLGFRFGVNNSNGSRISADNMGQSNATFLNYTGYQATTNFGSSSAGKTALRERTPSATSTNLTGGSDWTSYSGTSSAGVNLSSGTVYTGLFTISRETSDTVKVTFNLNGITTTITDTTGVFSFDTITMNATSLGTTISFSDISVMTSAIPEPGTGSLTILSGSLMALGVCLRRCRRSASIAL